MGLPPDLRELYQQAYAAGSIPIPGASAAKGGSDQNAVNTDDFMWNHPDLIILFSAGNEGPNGTTVAPPSKNYISMGVSENDWEDGYPSDTAYYSIPCSLTDRGGRTSFPTSP